MKKVLSDGTIAKDGMIVVVIDGNLTGGNESNTITRIENVKSGWSDFVECLHIEDGEVYRPYAIIEDLENLREATDEEKLLFTGYKDDYNA